MIGLPGAGKSTFYRERLAATHDHISKDVMQHNRRPDRRQAELLDQSLSAGRSAAIDNTNPSAADRRPLIAAARRHGAEVTGYFFPSDTRDALRRNRQRTGRARVPDVAIFTTRKRLEVPSYGEGFDRLFIVTADETARSFEVTPLDTRA